MECDSSVPSPPSKRTEEEEDDEEHTKGNNNDDEQRHRPGSSMSITEVGKNFNGKIEKSKGLSGECEMMDCGADDGGMCGEWIQKKIFEEGVM